MGSMSKDKGRLGSVTLNNESDTSMIIPDLGDMDMNTMSDSKYRKLF